jgi:nitrous oxidase accessory protein
MIRVWVATIAGLGALVAPSPRGAKQTFLPPPDAGPAAVEAQAGAVVATDAEDLRRLLASGPAEIWLDARVYHGDFRIERPVVVRGLRGASVEGTGIGSVIEIHADDVSIENLIVRGSGRRQTTEDAGIKATGSRIRLAHLQLEDNLFGVSLLDCKQCAIEQSVVRGHSTPLEGDGIKLWEADDGIVTDNLVEGTRDVVVWYSRRVRLERNLFRHNRYGTHFMYAHDSSVRDSRFVDNVVGIFVMYSARLSAERNVLAGARGAAGMGIGFKDSDRVTVRDNWLVANTTGAYLDRTPRSPSDPVDFSGNVFALNDTALRFHSSQRGAAFLKNDFRDNVQAAAVDGGGDALEMQFRGNYWSDYAGYDLDGDGRGDVPFEVKQLTSAVTDAHPALRFFEGAPAMGMMDAVAQAVPVLSLKKMLVDPEPAMKELR